MSQRGGGAHHSDRRDGNRCNCFLVARHSIDFSVTIHAAWHRDPDGKVRERQTLHMNAEDGVLEFQEK